MKKRITELKRQDVTFDGDGFSVRVGFVNASPKYSDVESLELRRSIDLGILVTGARNDERYAGMFENKEFGRYQAVVHPSVPEVIVVRYDSGKTLVFNRKTLESTETTFDILSLRSKE